MRTPQPIYLFADSQLLFWKNKDQLYLERVRAHIKVLSPKAAYVGASNGDMPEFYELFLAAMNNIGITHCRMVSAFFEQEDQDFLNQADIILLAGGDVALGWKTFQSTGLDAAIRKRYVEGALLMGISAGAVQIGQCALSEEELPEVTVLRTLGILPFAIGVHEEKAGWRNLKSLMLAKEDSSRAIGIQAGGGLVYHLDGSIEPVKYPLSEFIYTGNGKKLTNSLIYPEVRCPANAT